jgi:hypothetical protein
MIRRDDLPQVIAVAGEHGFRFRHAAGLEPHPVIHPVRAGLHGQDFWVIQVLHLVKPPGSSPATSSVG